MEKNISTPILMQNFKAEEGFWKDRIELIRKNVLLYQWDILNDRVEDAAPSYCMRNFRIAAMMNQKRKELGDAFVEPVYVYGQPGLWPEDENDLKDIAYGCPWQDTDFSKWIEAVAYSLALEPDEELEKAAEEAIDIVCAAQLDNGYLDTHFITRGMNGSFKNLKDYHELYCFGHFLEGAVAYYQATGKDRLLKAAMRFADYVDAHFGHEEGKMQGYPGHEVAEMALIRLYEVTGKEKYLNLSRYFIDERGKQPYYWDKENDDANPNWKEQERYEYYQAHRPVRLQDEAMGHSVRATYLYSGMADVARLTDDEELKTACRKLWNSTVREKMYITGAIGGTKEGEAFSFPFDLPNDLAYAETCAAIGLVFFARRMLQMEAKAEYADVMERALYNCVLSGMDLEGKRFFYVNPLEVLPEACHKDKRKEHVLPVRPKWFGCACCPPNLARLISSVPSYAYAENEDTLFMHLHMAGTVVKKVGDKEAVFAVKTDMPENGNVEIAYTAQEPVAMKLAVRIPGWCENWGVSGTEAFHCTEKDGYYYIEGVFTENDKICFVFEMKPCFYQADSRVREDIGKVALMKGPVVYCAEERDNTDSLHLYRVMPQENAEETEVIINGEAFPALKLKAAKMVADNAQRTLYTKYRNVQYEEAVLTMIPYYAWANRGENEMMVWFAES